MTEDTIFDLASLTKCLATATVVMQLHEQGKVRFDDPVQQYLPDFNPATDPKRARVTVRMLVTHTSGEAGDVDLKDPWGLDGADKAEGIHRALTTPLQSGPGQIFYYSDINFILLGALIPLRPWTLTFSDTYSSPLAWKTPATFPRPKRVVRTRCEEPRLPGLPRQKAACWPLVLQIGGAPAFCRASHRQHLTKRAEPIRARILTSISCFGGTVHDTTARRMGGVAGHTARQLEAANEAFREAVANRPNTTDPLLARHYPAVTGQNLRGFGWDIDTAQSTARDIVFLIGSLATPASPEPRFG